MTDRAGIRRFLLAAALVLVNITAHFLPFERAALGPDDYASIVVSERGVSLFTYAGRPLNSLFLSLQSAVIGDNAAYGFILLLISSAFLLICVFLLLDNLLRDEIYAFFAGVIFCLLPNTLEIYHTAIFANMNFAISVYILCLLFYLKYLDSGRVFFLGLSLFLYAVGIFWYEVGFFTPLIILIAALLRRKEKALSWLLFLPLSFVFIVYRMTGAFGLATGAEEAHAVSLGIIPFNLAEVLHQYAGRYMARSLLYGLYRFPSVEMPWFLFICLLDILTVLFIVNLVRRYTPKKSPSAEAVLLACAISIFWLAPILLNQGGGVAGRHLVLPSVGISVIGLWSFNFIRRGRGLAAGVILFFLLAVSQGNAWSQVVACRINAAVYDYLQERAPELKRASCIVIDARSFADNIPFTFVKRDFNNLNTYYGAQAFEEWGLKSMAKIAAGDRQKAVYVAKTRPRILSGRIEFEIPDYQGYRSEGSEDISVDARGCLIVDYDSVYARGFANGIGRK